MSFVLLEIEYSSRYRTELENAILSKDIYEKYKDCIDDVLNNSWWPDFNGKHGHVDGNYSVEYLDYDKAYKMFVNDEIVGLERSHDCLADELPNASFTEVVNDMKNAFKNIKLLDLKIDLSSFDNIEDEKSKIINLLKVNGYKII